ncbi:dihydrofolate reductase family protein [Thalassoroseus pseudoceratinae]|uniref:dihydrofolate reductase family protein n=1 Tax=Thalassoroseus pseudoceratinae TaxID=2713176 RepID=UPI0014242F01|nr:dihydrofolate reductase family protein [Thalassoroseus pseudoceratinae]
MQITYHVAASEDLLIARPDGDVTWLEQADINLEETGITEFMAEIDGIAMGRKTYDFVFDFGAWPYGAAPAWVCTSKPLDRLPNANLHATSSVTELINAATSYGVKHMWLLGGGQLASAFLDRGLITTICVTQLPVKLGNGIPLFSDHMLLEIPHQSKTVESKNGFKTITVRF